MQFGLENFEPTLVAYLLWPLQIVRLGLALPLDISNDFA